MQFDIGEQISRKEYLRRKKKNSQSIKKRSKITYILMATFMALAIYIVVQVVVYRKYNSFKYTIGDGVSSQAVYNIYFVTEGYTYDPIYSISSISSLGENEKTVLPSSNINDIVVEKDYIYGTRDGAVCKVTKDKYEIEELFNDNVKKYVKDGNMIFYTCANGGVLKSYNEETKEVREFDISDVEQILIDSGNVFAITHKTDEKAIYKFDYAGGGKKKNISTYQGFYDLLRKYGYELEIIFTKAGGDGRKIIQGIDQSVDLVISAGGDGTLNEIVSGNLMRKKPLTIAPLPLGSTNDVGNMYGLNETVFKNLEKNRYISDGNKNLIVIKKGNETLLHDSVGKIHAY